MPNRLFHFKQVWLFVICLTLCGTSSSNAQAQGTSQVESVYQLSDELLADLTLLHQYNLTRVNYSPNLATKRELRHVRYLATETFLRIQTLLALNGLPKQEAPSLSSVASDIKTIQRFLGASVQGLAKLKTHFKVSSNRSSSSRFQQNNALNVYAKLHQAGLMITQLGVPLSPNDVFRLGMGVAAVAEKITELEVELPYIPSVGKSPNEVYVAAQNTYQLLMQYCEQNSTQCVEKVDLPYRKPQGEIVPSMVHELLSNLLADFRQINSARDVDISRHLFRIQKGKSLSDAFDLIQSINTRLKSHLIRRGEQ